MHIIRALTKRCFPNILRAAFLCPIYDDRELCFFNTAEISERAKFNF